MSTGDLYWTCPACGDVMSQMFMPGHKCVRHWEAKMREAVGGQDNVRVEFEGAPDAPDRVSVVHDLAEYAWGIIANAGGGDWTTQNEEWQEAAAKWRDQYHDYLAKFTRQESDVEALVLAEEVVEAAEIADMERLA